MDLLMRFKVPSLQHPHIKLNTMRKQRHNRLPLGADLLPSLVGLTFLLIILSDPVKEIVPSTALPYMFNSDMESLLHLTLFDLLVDGDADGALADVEDTAGAAVVELVGHAGVDGAVDDDVYVVSDFVFLEVVLHADGSVATEGLFEFVTGS